MDFNSNLSRALRGRGVSYGPARSKAFGRGLRRVFALAFASCERTNRDAAARDVSAVTGRVHIKVSAPARAADLAF